MTTQPDCLRHGGDRTAHVILPAFNEAESLPPLLGRFAELRTKISNPLVVWVIDDGSSDATAKIAQAGVNGLDVRLVQHAENRGLGQGLQTGIRAVLQAAQDEDLVTVMDADDTHDVNLMPLMAERIDEGRDIVIASRFVAGGDDRTAPAFRRLLSRGASVIFRILFPLDGFSDFTSGFRTYRVSLLRTASRHWGERLIEERGFACMVELLLKLRHWNPKVAEVPLVLRYDRKQGASKLKLFRTLRQYLKLALRDRLAPPPVPVTLVPPLAGKPTGKAVV